MSRTTSLWIALLVLAIGVRGERHAAAGDNPAAKPAAAGNAGAPTPNSPAPNPIPFVPSEIVINNNSDGKTADITVIGNVTLDPNQDASITPGVADVTPLIPSVTVICQPTVPCAATGPLYQIQADGTKKTILIQSTATAPESLQVSYRQTSLGAWNVAKHEIHLCSNADTTPGNVVTSVTFTNPPADAGQQQQQQPAKAPASTTPAATAPGTTTVTTTTTTTTTTAVTTAQAPNGSKAPAGYDWKNVKITLKQSASSDALYTFDNVTLTSGTPATKHAGTLPPVKVRRLYQVELPGLKGRNPSDGDRKESLAVTRGFLLINDETAGQLLLKAPVEIWGPQDTSPALTGQLDKDLAHTTVLGAAPVQAAVDRILPFAFFASYPDAIPAMKASVANKASLQIQPSGQTYSIMEEWKITYASTNAPSNAHLLYLPAAETLPADWADATSTYFAVSTGSNSTFKFVLTRTIVKGIPSRDAAQRVLGPLATAYDDMLDSVAKLRKAQAALDGYKSLYTFVSAWKHSDRQQAALRQYQAEIDRQTRLVAQQNESEATAQLRFEHAVQAAQGQFAN